MLNRRLARLRPNRNSNRIYSRAAAVEQLEDRTLLAATILQNAQDNHLTNFQSQQANLGGFTQLQFYKSGTSVYRPMLDFNTSSIAAGSSIGDAQLQLWHEDGLYANGNMNVTVYASAARGRKEPGSITQPRDLVRHG